MGIEAKELELPAVLEIIRSNIVTRKNPLALEPSRVGAWARGLDLPRRGPTLLFTGGEYQLAPYIHGLARAMASVDQGGRAWSALVGVRNLLSRAGLNVERLYASLTARDRERYDGICRKAAVVLGRLGVDVCWLGEREMYSGALLYELGYLGGLRGYAAELAGLIGDTGAGTVICLSPHSAEVLKLVYPGLVPGFAPAVKTFTEVVVERGEDVRRAWRPGRGGPDSGRPDSGRPGRVQGEPGRAGASGRGRSDPGGPGRAPAVTLHDSCRLARQLGAAAGIRDLLRGLGVEVTEVGAAGCCGGPAKILYPEISAAIASRRAGELARTGAGVALTFCPYCLAAFEALEAPKGGGDAGEAAGEAGPAVAGPAVAFQDFVEFIHAGVGADDD